MAFSDVGSWIMQFVCIIINCFSLLSVSQLSSWDDSHLTLSEQTVNYHIHLSFKPQNHTIVMLTFQCVEVGGRAVIRVYYKYIIIVFLLSSLLLKVNCSHSLLSDLGEFFCIAQKIFISSCRLLLLTIKIIKG